jgi:magnesium-transporting ATPase (P-type)
MTEGSQLSFHSLPTRDVLSSVGSTSAGLTSEEASARLRKFGSNRLPEPVKQSALVRFLSHFHNVLIYVLFASAVVTAALQHWVDTGVILAVVVANAVISRFQEGRAEQAMAAIKGMLAPHS